MQAIAILMPSGMMSRPHECADEEETLKLATLFASQMKGWRNFEAWLVLLENDKEISRDHIRSTQDQSA
jgi:hypothetical protein